MANRPGPAVLQVHIFRDGEFLGTDVFAERQIVVGRDPDEADLVLESSQVSRRHAIIENEGGRVTVRDAGSTNGVFLNADKVVNSVEVTRLDEIRIGEFALKLKFASKGKGAGEESAPVPALERRPGDSTRELQAMSKTGQAAALPRDERTAPAPVAASAAPKPAPRAEANASRSRMPASASDLSEFDDVPDEPTDELGRAPRAEFRKRDEPVDRDKLGDMLAGIGIAEPGVNSPTTVDASPLPMARGDSESKRRGGKGKGAAFADLASELEGPEAATRTNITGFDSDEGDDTRREASRGMNGKSMNGGGRAYSHAHGAALARDELEPESIPSAAPVQARGMPKAPDMLGLDGDPMAAFEPHADVTHDDDHDDHDEDDDYIPTYSLAQHILGDELPPKHGVPRVEILAVRDDVVDSVVLLAPGESYWVGPESTIARLMAKAANKEGGAVYKPGPRFELVKHKRPGEVEVEFKKESRGMVVRGGRSVELGSVQGRQGRKQVRRGTQIMGLSRGEIAQVHDGPTTYHIRQVIAPAPLRDDRPFIQRIRPEKLLLTSALSAFLVHIVVMSLMTLLGGPPEMKEKVQEEFIEVTVEPEMKLEEPPKPPEPPPPEPTPPAPTPPPVPMKQPKMKQPKVAAVAPAPPNPAPVGVLGLLNKKGPTQAPGPAAAVAAISNLAAAKTPSGSSGYKVSGLIGKLPTSDLSIGGGGGGPMTKGAAALLRGGGGGAGVLTGKATGQVRSLVTKMPQGMRAQGGSLDREEIQKVVNKHIGEIQRCYERELLKTPTLAGKVTIEWVVATSGAVKSSRQKDATLQSSGAVNCMLASVKGWQFPQPRGGEVVVSYPFNFSSIGM